VTNGRYAADADMMLYNGPYVLSEWVHGASMRWVKNPLYWNDDKGFSTKSISPTSRRT
jgi:oligopeptide transport system substrate-binding protein